MILYETRQHPALESASVVALGTFDGLHRGHLTVIEKMLSIGRARQLKTVVFTFSDIPKHVAAEATSKIMSNVEKLDWLAQMGVDVVVSLPFDAAIQQTTHRDFFEYILTELKAAAIVVGENFKFGKAVRGDVAWLSAQCAKRGCQCLVVAPVKLEGEVISSTAIRELLINGQIEAANRRLGRPHFVSGTVKLGKQIGQTLGFATANLTVQSYMTNIKPGVYITETKIADRFYPSVSNVGYNPTFQQSDFNLETHILDFNRPLYGENIAIYFIKRLRDELTFANTTDLVAQIECDVKAARQHFSTVRAEAKKSPLQRGRHHI